MPLKHIIFQRLFLSIYLLIGIVIPGSSLLLAKKNKWAFGTPLLGVMWVVLLSWTRWVITPTGFMVMLVGLLALHVFSYALGLKIGIKKNDITPSLKTWVAFVLRCCLIISIVMSCHLYKDKWFGFAFYHIPSESMRPTLQVGDVILVDAWAFNKKTPAMNDIVLFHLRGNNEISFVKRVIGQPGNQLAVGPTSIKPYEESSHFDSRVRHVDIGTDQYYLVGDHRGQSRDSRYFGAIDQQDIYAKAMYVMFSRDTEEFNLKRSGTSLTGTAYQEVKPDLEYLQ
jgi:signal peptidase I